MIYYPAFLDLKGKKVLLFGAGEVALRKAKSLFKAGARVTVVSREFSKPFMVFAKRAGLTLIRGSEIPKLSRTWLVVAATSDRKLNQKIYGACVKNRVFVNIVDDPKRSSFIVPSVVSRGRFQLAISTGGASPMLAKMVRLKLEKQFGPEYARMLKELAQSRDKAKKTISGTVRKNYFHKQVMSRLNVIARRIAPKQSLRSHRALYARVLSGRNWTFFSESATPRFARLAMTEKSV
jgi:siroheme synthase-like protein